MASKTLPASGTFFVRFIAGRPRGRLALYPVWLQLALCCPRPSALTPGRRCRTRPRGLAKPGSPLGFMVEGGFVLQAIVAREPAHQRAVRPIVEHPAHTFPRDACHRGEVALGDFLPNEDAPLAEVVAERLGEIQQRARHASLHGEKVGG